jgi:hypothetical protein
LTLQTTVFSSSAYDSNYGSARLVLLSLSARIDESIEAADLSVAGPLLIEELEAAIVECAEPVLPRHRSQLLVDATVRVVEVDTCSCPRPSPAVLRALQPSEGWLPGRASGEPRRRPLCVLLSEPTSPPRIWYSKRLGGSRWPAIDGRQQRTILAVIR